LSISVIAHRLFAPASHNNATPATYEVNGRQLLVIAAGGGTSPNGGPGGVYVPSRPHVDFAAPPYFPTANARSTFPGLPRHAP
jgi:hypothetical protein